MNPNTAKRLRRVINKKTLKTGMTEPKKAWSMVRHHLHNGLGLSAETLLQRPFVHVASFATSNAGDTLLPVVLRDLFQQQIGGIKWSPLHVHDIVTEDELEVLNRNAAVVVGGGGLFLKDTNKNQISGWQWPISTESIRQLSSHLVIFAVGYNRFRGQGEFDDLFKENVIELVRKASFVGLRNHGSIRNLQSYMPDELKEKISFQPCMTTLLRHIYPEHFQSVEEPEPFIVLNCAFDRSDLRFGEKQGTVLEGIAEASKRLSARMPIHYFAHDPADEKMLPYLDRAGLKYKLVRLYYEPSAEVLRQYKKPALTLGMRGHAQMIPFGCERPIVSLISHDKLRWFLDDIEATDWGVELAGDDLADRIVATSEAVLNNPETTTKRLREQQAKLWKITSANMAAISSALWESK